MVSLSERSMYARRVDPLPRGAQGPLGGGGTGSAPHTAQVAAVVDSSAATSAGAAGAAALAAAGAAGGAAAMPRSTSRGTARAAYNSEGKTPTAPGARSATARDSRRKCARCTLGGGWGEALRKRPLHLREKLYQRGVK